MEKPARAGSAILAQLAVLFAVQTVILVAFVWAIVVLSRQRDWGTFVVLCLGLLYVAYRTWSAGRKFWLALFPRQREEEPAGPPRSSEGDEEEI